MSGLPYRQPFRQPYRQQSRQMSTDPHNELNPHADHYVGIDVGTGSARACVIDARGDIVGLASENIGLWQPEQGFYEQSTTDIWRCICTCMHRILDQHNLDASTIRGIAFDATCSLAVFTEDTDEPMSVTGPKFDTERNVVLWLDHRPVEETAKINATNHNLLRYVGGTMSIEMEIPKVLWLKNHMPKETFDRCKFYDLADALTHLATGNEDRSFCSTVCKQGYVPVGVDGSVKGWQGDFLTAIGLEDLVQDDFRRLGGVNGQNGTYRSAGEKCGVLSAKAAQDLGLPAGIAVGSGVIDAYAGWVGTVGAKVPLSRSELSHQYASNDRQQAFTRLAAVAGTSTCHIAMSPEPVFVKGVWGPYRDVLIPGYWMAEGGQSATGELLKHVLETHPAFQHALAIADSYNANIYDFLNEHLRDMQAKAEAPTVSYLGRHLFFYGDLFGNRSPIADPRMTGSIIGLSSDKSMDGLALYYYATMEFIALQTHQIILTMNNSGHQIKSIFMSGSQCQNGILMDLMASACDVPVIIPRYVHAAVVHGAAMLGAKAASADKSGKTEPLWEIMDRMSKPGKVVHPTNDADEKALLAVKYKVFLEQCQHQQDYRRDVDVVANAWGTAGKKDVEGDIGASNQNPATSAPPKTDAQPSSSSTKSVPPAGSLESSGNTHRPSDNAPTDTKSGGISSSNATTSAPANAGQATSSSIGKDSPAAQAPPVATKPATPKPVQAPFPNASSSNSASPAMPASSTIPAVSNAASSGGAPTPTTTPATMNTGTTSGLNGVYSGGGHAAGTGSGGTQSGTGADMPKDTGLSAKSGTGVPPSSAQSGIEAVSAKLQGATLGTSSQQTSQQQHHQVKPQLNGTSHV